MARLRAAPVQTADFFADNTADYPQECVTAELCLLHTVPGVRQRITHAAIFGLIAPWALMCALCRERFIFARLV